MIRLTVFLFITLLLVACGPAAKIKRTVKKEVLSDSSLRQAHVGISVYDAGAGKFLFNYQGNKYFVPASNTKIPTCYAAMRFLGDSIEGLEYFMADSLLVFRGTADPTLLHSDFQKQPVLEFLKRQQGPLAIAPSQFTANRWGAGWTVSDINASYMPERSELPVYGNVLRLYRRGDSIFTVPPSFRENVSMPAAGNWRIRFERPSLSENYFVFFPSNQNFSMQELPFVTGNYMSAWVLLMDTLKKNISAYTSPPTTASWKTIHSQPVDSLLKIMMHRSDNFFAEQSLLMVSRRLLGEMNDVKVIDTLLKTMLAGLPHKPRWADGSGLSRYNLFTPQDFVVMLTNMKNEFGMERLKTILPTGNEGTLTNYYQQESGYVFAKTGTLSGVVALSGYLQTTKNRLLIFSVLVNNHQSSAPAVRRAVEKFIRHLRQGN